jgi:biopolymer transport protein TolR
MSDRRHRERGRLPVRAEINVTSLVDVAFTLLVIFIITAPVLQGGVDVNLPEGQVGSIEASDQHIIVSVRADGTVFLGETPVDVENISGVLGQLLRANQQDAVYVRADSAARYGIVFNIVSTVASQEGVGLYLIGVDEVP